MARFDVHAPLTGEGLLLDVQAAVMDHLFTRIAVPLLPRQQAPRAHLV